MDLTNSSFDLSGFTEEVVETSIAVDNMDSSNVTPDVLKCNDCNYTTGKKYNLQRHLKTHCTKVMTSTPKKGLCEIMSDQCEKYFKSKYGLRLHVNNKHDNIFKHVCNVCGKGYNQSLQFRFHTAQHVDVKLLKCQECKKELSGPWSLKRHTPTCKSTETQSRHACADCGTVFKSTENLSYHKKGMHEAPRYKCDICGKILKWRSSLRVHKKIHIDN